MASNEKKLKNLINEIINDPTNDNTQKLLRLINLAENAFKYGDIASYQEIFTIVKKLNPKIENQKFNSLNINKINIEPLPDIDFSIDPTED